MSTFELTVELDEIQANRLTSLLHEREKLVDGMYEKVLMFPCVNWSRVFICLNKSSKF